MAATLLVACALTVGCSSPEELRGVPATGTAALFYANSTEPGVASLVCSATVVDDRVVTAAHCVPDGRPVRIAVGPIDLCGDQPIQTTEVMEVHRPEAPTDVAVLVPLSPLPRGEPAATGKSDSWAVTGWGSTPGSFRCDARTVDLVVTTGCSEDSHSVLCLTGETANTCTGDSGAGVIDASGRLVAVTSSGAGCAAGDPGAYVSLTTMAGWLATVGVELDSGPLTGG